MITTPDNDGDNPMPLDMFNETQNRVPARLRANMARAGILNDPAACDCYLMDRFPNWKRVAFMRDLHPTAYCATAIPA